MMANNKMANQSRVIYQIHKSRAQSSSKGNWPKIKPLPGNSQMTIALQQQEELEAMYSFLAMHGAVPQRSLQKWSASISSFSTDMGQAIVQDHGYDSAEKPSHFKAEDIGILVKRCHSQDRKHNDVRRDSRISMSLMVQTGFILFHRMQ